MNLLKPFSLAAFAALGLLLLGTPSTRAQDDLDLDKLLEKVEEQEKAEAKTEPADNADKSDPAKPSDPQAEPKQTEKKSGTDEVADKDLDDLLKGLSESDDEPEAKGKRSAMPGGEGQENQPPAPGEPEDANADKLKGQKKSLDEHLEELTGRKRRRDQEGDPNSPLAQTIKKMDDVDKKLEEKDTGEKTRQKQQQIVEELKTLIKQARTVRIRTRSRQPGQPGKPGQQQPGDQASNTGDGVGPQMPKKYEAKSILAQNKDVWGSLPPELRGEMENVFKEDALPRRKTLIDRYYLSISQKSLGRSEGR